MKRLGYAVTRVNPPSSHYPTPPPRAVGTPSSILSRILSLFSHWTSKLRQLFSSSSDWWRPLTISRWLHHDKNYRQSPASLFLRRLAQLALIAHLFRSLRFMSAGHGIPLHHPDPEKRREIQMASPYKIFYNLYKPNTPFKKSAPPPPDFQIVVIKYVVGPSHPI